MMYNFVRRYEGHANGLCIGTNRDMMADYVTKEIKDILENTKDRIIILDTNGDLADFAKLKGGKVVSPKVTNEYALIINNEYVLNPCDMHMRWESANYSPLVEKCEHLIGFTETIFDRECSSFEIEAIHRACKRMYEPYVEEMKRRFKEGDNTDYDSNICPTLIDFYNQLTDDGTPESNRIAAAISLYCIGDYRAFSLKTNFEENERFIVFDVSSTFNRLKKIAAFVYLSFIQNQIPANRIKDTSLIGSGRLWTFVDYDYFIFGRHNQLLLDITKQAEKNLSVMTTLISNFANLYGTVEGISIVNHTQFIGNFDCDRSDLCIIDDLKKCKHNMVRRL